MPEQLSFAHLSDPHLPLPHGRPPLGLLAGKRLLGYLSWRRRRHREHRPEVLEALFADVAASRPDHVLVTGDLVNIALPAEFAAARAWLEDRGPPDRLTVVPGNHECFVAMPWAEGAGCYAPWMAGDDGIAAAGEGAAGFPFVRRRGPVAFVCLSTALPTPPFFATGTLGAGQLDRLRELLHNLGGKGAFRVVVLHHPPEDRPTRWRKALTDRAAFQRVLAESGAELVLHGHQHHSRFGLLPGPRGPVPVLGVPSASMGPGARKAEPARWHLLEVGREGDGWRLAMTARGVTPDGFRTLGRWRLSRGA